MAKRRVVVTGIGLVTPLGTGKEKTWNNILNGKSGAGPITRFDASGFASQIAAEVTDFVSLDHFDKKSAKHLDLFVQFGIVAARYAVEDSGLTIDESNCNRIGVITGCGMGGLATIEKNHTVFLDRGAKRISPFFIPMAIPNMPSGHISMQIGSKGPNLAFSTACSAGTHAVGEAYHSILRGACDAVVTGGTESVMCALGVGGFSSMKALSTRNDDPTKASRPFEKDRDGFLIAEGAGMLVLEELENAVSRGATIYAEIIGSGASSDAHHIAAPPEDGNGAARCIEAALLDAGLQPTDIDYINAHGTSTPLNDRCETTAIKSVFGEHAAKLAISSTKSMTGHALGAAGGLEAAFLAMSIKEQIAPPTINLDTPSDECDLDYVPHTARKMEIRAGISNSFGFGGTNGVIVMKRYDS
jgi:3-oxoacyl-[acyl-carrier-protein] synthase II